PPDADRTLEFWVSQLLYAGPILAGATLLDHVVVLGDFDAFDDPLSLFLASVPGYAFRGQSVIAAIVLALGTLLVVAYVVAAVRRARRGVPVSPARIWLVASTGLCSIYTWGLNSWGEAFF